MANTIIALFVEGPTEVEFYKAVIAEVRLQMNVPFDCKIKYIDMKGIGNYKDIALRKFNDLKTKNKGMDILVYLCIDSDVFEYSKKPPINKEKLQKTLQNAGAKKVTYIVAKKSIEDWFLYDLHGVLDYLHLPENTQRPRERNGQEALKKLFSKANKIYVKGGKTENFIEKLDVSKIIENICSSIKPLCSALKLDCGRICNKKRH